MDLRTLRSCIDPVGGVVRATAPLPLQPGDADIAIYRAFAGRGVVRQPGRELLLDGIGTDAAADIAEAKAIAEALEHYAANRYEDREFVTASKRDLGDDALDLDLVPRCSDEERSMWRMVPGSPSSDAPLRWVRGVTLPDFRPIWIPAVMTFLSLNGLSHSERFWFSTSTGCAVGSSPDEAIRRALLECVERDAIALTWLMRRALRNVDIRLYDNGSDELADTVARIRSSAIKMRVYDATTDVGIPVLWAMTWGMPQTVVGAGASVTFRPALNKALLECAQVSVTLRSAPPPPADPRRFRTLTDGAAYMSMPARRTAFDFLEGGARTGDTTSAITPLVVEGREEWEAITTRLGLLGMQAFLVDLTTRELAQLGLTAVRALVPQLQPLTFSQGARFLDSDRVKRTLLPTRSMRVNCDPYPFA